MHLLGSWNHNIMYLCYTFLHHNYYCSKRVVVVPRVSKCVVYESTLNVEIEKKRITDRWVVVMLSQWYQISQG